MPDLPLCETCKHYEQRERSNVVRVDLLDSGNYGHANTLMSMCNQDDAKWVVNDPPPNFGCIHHEEDDAEPKDHPHA